MEQRHPNPKEIIRSVVRHRISLIVTILLLSQATSPFAASMVAEHESSAGTVSTFVVGVPAIDGAIMDPALATDGASLLIARQVYDTLLFLEEGGTLPIPGLAESWDVTTDGLTWTFHLRSGISFHDGTPLDAAAVVANFQRWWDPGNPYHLGSFLYFEILFGGFRGDPSCLITAISAAGSSDVVITLQAPYSPLLSLLALPPFSIASPEAIASGALATTPVGSGPFRFVARTSEDLTLAADLDYWGGAPRSDVLTFRGMQSAVDRMNALKAGEVQVADYINPDTSDPLIRMLWRGSTSVGYLGINRSHSPLGDLLVRQAIAHLVDKSKLAGINQNARIATQFLPSGVWGGDPSVVDYAYDPALARSLLSQAGYGSGLTTTLSYRNVARGYMSNPKATAEALKADFADGGITLELKELGSSDFLAKVDSGEVDLFLLGWAADYPHPDNFFRQHFCTDWAAFLPRDETLCAVLEDELTIGDLVEQQGLYQWASRRVHDTVPVVPLLNGASPLGVRYNVGGVTPSPIMAESYHNAETIPEGTGTVTPGRGGSVGYLQNNRFTSLRVPAGAVTSPTAINIIPANPAMVPTSLAFAGHAFDIEAYQGEELMTGLPLVSPARLDVEYADADVERIRENTLNLYVWDGVAWSPATETCLPPSAPILDMVNHRISAPICHLSRFALFGEPLQINYLPLVLR